MNKVGNRVELLKRNDLNKNSIDGLLVIDVKNSNPNGDPDINGEPRQDIDGFGLISAVSIKRKIRDLISTASIMEDARSELNLPKTGFEILESHETKGAFSENLKTLVEIDTKDFCKRFVDVRLFGCQLLTPKKEDADGGALDGEEKKAKGKKSKMVADNNKVFRGCVQFAHGSSISKINVTKQTLTAKTGIETGKDRGMAPDGLKIVNHAVYTVPFSYRPFVGEVVGVVSDDLRLFFWLLEKAYLACSLNRSGVNIVREYVGVHKERTGSFNTYSFLQSVTPIRNSEDKYQPSYNLSDYTLPDMSVSVSNMSGDFYSLI